MMIRLFSAVHSACARHGKQWTACSASALLVFWCAAGTAATAPNSDYPSKPIRLVVPFAPGGGTDISARSLGEQLRTILDQPIVIDNRPGGSGRTGTQTVANATPDGYTLLVTTASTTTVLYALDKKLAYDPRKDLTPIGMIGDIPEFLAIEAGFPAKSVTELVEYARSHPGTMNYGSSGSGTITHLVSELFLQATGTKMTHVPFKGESDRLRALLGKEIQVAFVALANMYVSSNRVRILATTSPTPWPPLPDVPTFASLGMKNMDFMAWTALFASRGTPPAIVAKLNAALNTAVRADRLKSVMNAAGFQPRGGTPQALANAVKREIDMFTGVIEKAGIKVDQ